VLIADAVAVREHPDRVRATLGERGLEEWQARTAAVTTAPAAPGADREPCHQLTLGLGAAET
jgi:hypothetical protein